MKDYKTKLTEEQVAIEEKAIQNLFMAVKEAVNGLEEGVSITSSDFRNSEKGKEAVKTFFSETKKYLKEEEEVENKENEEEEGEGEEKKVDESLYFQNVANTDALIESMISVLSLYKGKDASFDVFSESRQGDKALGKYMRATSKLAVKNQLKEAEEEMKEEDEEPLDNVTEEEKEALEKFAEAFAKFVKESETNATDKETNEEEEEDLKESETDAADKETNEEEEEDTETKNVAEAFLKSEAGKSVLKECAKSFKSVSIKLGSALDKKLDKTSKTYATALSESIEAGLAKSPLTKLGTLNEAQTKELSALVSEAVKDMASNVTKQLKEEMISECEEYVNAEVIPSVLESFDNKYVPKMKEEMAASVDKYINYVATQIAEDLNSNGLLVKSRKSVQLEEFSEAVLSLIKEKLTIIPEQESEMDRLIKRNTDLKTSLTEAKVEIAKMANRITDLRKENYVISALPENLSEATKEKLLGYAQDVLWEACDDVETFKEEFDKAVDEAEAMEKDDQEELEKSESLKKKFGKKEAEEEVCPICGKSVCSCDKHESEEDKEETNEEEEEDNKVNEWLKAALSLGGLNEEEEPEDKNEEEEEKSVEEDDQEEPIDEKIKRLGKRK